MTRKKKIFLGIDLGTTFSEIAIVNESGAVEVIQNCDGDLKTASVVSYSSGQPVVGKAALPDAFLAPDFFFRCAKRSMGKRTPEGKPIPLLMDPSGREIIAVDVSADILRCLKMSAEQYLGPEVEDLVVTVPAYFNEIARSDTIIAAKMAGFKNVITLDEPVAAAMHHGLLKGQKNMITVVIDSGGGTTDVTAIEIKDQSIDVIATDGDESLGGTDTDEAIFNDGCRHAKANGVEISIQDDAGNFNENLQRCCEGKEMLSKRDSVTIALQAKGKRVAYELTRKKFLEINKPYDERFKDCCNRLLKELKSRGKKIDQVLLVGGNCRQFHVSEMVKGIFGIEPSRDVNPDLVVAQGAAVRATTVFGNEDQQVVLGTHRYLAGDIKMHTVAAHAICVAARNSKTDPEEYNCVIVPANIPLPYEFEKRFAPNNPGATSVVIKLVQGRPDELSKNSTLIREINVPIKPSNIDENRITIKGRYTEEGLLKLTIVDALTGKPISDSFIHKSGIDETE
jgi:molecular chaperone DnaK